MPRPNPGGRIVSSVLWGRLDVFISRLHFKLVLDRRNFSKCRQAQLIAKMLDLVGGCRLREAEMVLPSLCRIGKVGINVGAVKDVSGSTGIENSSGRYGKSRKRPNSARLVVPDQASFSERHPAK